MKKLLLWRSPRVANAGQLSGLPLHRRVRRDLWLYKLVSCRRLMEYISRPTGDSHDHPDSTPGPHTLSPPALIPRCRRQFAQFDAVFKIIVNLTKLKVKTLRIYYRCLEILSLETWAIVVSLHIFTNSGCRKPSLRRNNCKSAVRRLLFNVLAITWDYVTCLTEDNVCVYRVPQYEHTVTKNTVKMHIFSRAICVE